MSVVWLGCLSVPLVVALMLAADEPTRRLGRAMGPYAAMPMLLLALFWPQDDYAEASWWMLGGEFGLDAIGQLFLLFTATLWTVAGFFSRTYSRGDPQRERFAIFFLLAMTGNLGLIGSQDFASFYLFFALMTFSSFGLVIHQENDFARFAANIYIAMAVFGEALLLIGLMMAAQVVPDWNVRHLPAHLLQHPQSDLVMVFLFGGFGVKAGLLLLHMWLPLAHPAAPTPASAVLSGAMIKAGLLGWLRFLPGGEVPLPVFGGVVIGFGIAAAFYGVAVGLLQQNAKTSLAYSSVSQMGFMVVGVGVGLVHPADWQLASLAVALYALHHALAKGALFLAVGIAQSAVENGKQLIGLYIGMGIAGFSLAGAPFSSGYLAKSLLKELTGQSTQPWIGRVEGLLPIAAVGTTLLMGRVAWLIHHERRHPDPVKRGLWPSWWIAIGLVVCLTWLAPLWYDITRLDASWLEGEKLWLAFWPPALGALLTAIALWRRWKVPARYAVPAGDVMVVPLWAADQTRRGWHEIVLPISVQVSKRSLALRNRLLLKLGRVMFRSEAIIVRWGAGGIMFVLLILLILVALVATNQH